MNELSLEQRRAFINTTQIYQSYRETYQHSLHYKGSMRWKKSNGKEYLFHGNGGKGYGKSLGVHSSKTEAIYEQFRAGKQRNKERLESLKAELLFWAKYCKLLKLNRVPNLVANILRLLEKQRLLGNNVMVIGTNALYAYEMLTGVHLQSDMLATYDLDILWDARTKLKLIVDEYPSILNILRKADYSFERSKSFFRASNNKGFLVDLIKPEPKPPWKAEAETIGDKNDLVATSIASQRWIVSSPKIEQIVIGEDGFPVPMVVPDPRAFVIHKWWLSHQVDREKIKARRDERQALVLAELIQTFLPNFPFSAEELKMFPKSMICDLPVGF
ncbi:nucleotidyltransferase domain-containing protein [Candidatus Parabeggiatoa sp. HSG14]|uniref:nucleotidyltransferase domain-containing protein n=1 Tax=Candidatus Parabeggiatoa sp. HSG14 TaxID=3055593 RepID=UPI0025A9255C|nr:nucleotidyltransferase domain-containing protein [Thiotrichales bacterium HSG14]